MSVVLPIPYCVEVNYWQGMRKLLPQNKVVVLAPLPAALMHGLHIRQARKPDFFSCSISSNLVPSPFILTCKLPFFPRHQTPFSSRRLSRSSYLSVRSVVIIKDTFLLIAVNFPASSHISPWENAVMLNGSFSVWERYCGD